MNSQRVGAVVDQAIAEKDRLGSRRGFSSACAALKLLFGPAKTCRRLR